MHCTVWRSTRKELTYLYLAEDCAFEDLPAALRASFGHPVHVMDLHLTAQRRLAREDAGRVMANLATHGWHLQLPPETDLEETIARGLGPG